MKKYNPQPLDQSKTFLISEALESQFYGLSRGDGKLFLAKAESRSYEMRNLSLEGVNYQYHTFEWFRNALHSIKKLGFKIFKFDTEKELFAWLADLDYSPENSTKKEYVSARKQNTFSEDDLSESKFYGTETKRGKDKSMVHRQSFLTGKFRAYCSDPSFTNGNSYGEFDSLKSMVLSLDETQNIYQFDTAKELFAWLAQ